MNEKDNTPKQEKPRYVEVATGLSLQEYMDRNASTSQGQPRLSSQQPQPQYRQPYLPQQYQPQPRQVAEPLPTPLVEKLEATKSKLPKLRKLSRNAIIASGVGALVIGGAYVSNTGNVQEFVSNALPGANQANSLEITPLETLGEKSLAPNQCKDPNAVLMVATINGSFPLVPMLATTESPTPTKAGPYLTENSKSSLPREQQQKFEKFITETGYPEATLNNLPLALTICEPTGANAITEQDGALTINRSVLEVSFEDPNGLFQTNINAVLQAEGATDIDIDPKKGEFMSLPNPANNMFLSQSTDEVYNKSVTDMIASMQTPQQLQVILASMEAGAIQQLDNVVDGHENIDYPDNASTLQQAIDKALVKRLVGETKVSPIFTGNYNVQMDVPKDPTTKQPITNNDPTTGASPLKNIDPTQQFKISNIDIEYGTITPPDIPEETTPSVVTETEPTTGP
jgi:hypothetical protein